MFAKMLVETNLVGVSYIWPVLLCENDPQPTKLWGLPKVDESGQHASFFEPIIINIGLGLTIINRTIRWVRVIPGICFLLFLRKMDNLLPYAGTVYRQGEKTHPSPVCVCVFLLRQTFSTTFSLPAFFVLDPPEWHLSSASTRRHHGWGAGGGGSGNGGGTRGDPSRSPAASAVLGRRRASWPDERTGARQK